MSDERRMRFPGITVPLEMLTPVRISRLQPSGLAESEAAPAPEYLGVAAGGPTDYRGETVPGEPDALELRSGWR